MILDDPGYRARIAKHLAKARRQTAQALPALTRGEQETLSPDYRELVVAIKHAHDAVIIASRLIAKDP